VIIFGFVRFLSKKKRSNKLVFLKKKTETGSNRPVLVWLVILEKKPVQPGFLV